MSKIIEDAETRKNITHIVTSGVVGAVLVPVITKAVKPIAQRVVVPALGPVAGTVVNVAFFVIIPPIASMVGEIVAEKGPKAVEKVSIFAKNISSRMKNTSNLQEMATELRLEEKIKQAQEANSKIVTGSMADDIRKNISQKANEQELENILNDFVNEEDKTA